MPLGASRPISFLPSAPPVTLRSAALSGRMYGRSNTSNSLTPSGPNLASDGASICTAPICSASSSSLSLYSVELAYTSTLTLPLVSSPARLAKNSDALPLGVSLATTWLNLITIGACASALPAIPSPAASATASVTRRRRDVPDVMELSLEQWVQRYFQASDTIFRRMKAIWVESGSCLGQTSWQPSSDMQPNTPSSSPMSS